jgi:hypothetical protein
VWSCFAILAASWALKLAAQYLLAALPVLVPLGLGLTVAVMVARWWWHRSHGW